MQNNPSLEKLILSAEHESELRSIGSKVQEKALAYSEQGIEKERKMIMREVLGDSSALPQVSTTTSSAATSDEAKKIKGYDNPRKLQALLEYTAAHGPVAASMLVKKVGDPWLDDEFHDTLITFHDELVRRNKLQEE